MVGQADVEVEIVIQVDKVYTKQYFKVEIFEHISLGVSLNESGEEDAGEQSEESVASGDEGYEGDTSDNDSDGYGTDTTITNESQSSDGWSELRWSVKLSTSDFFKITRVSSTYLPQNRGGLGNDVSALASKSSMKKSAMIGDTG